MKVAAKKKKQARFNHDGSEKAPSEWEALTPIEEKFCARVSKAHPVSDPSYFQNVFLMLKMDQICR